MLRLIIWALLIYIGYKFIVSLSSGGKKRSETVRAKNEEATVTYRDPVCGVYVSEEAAVIGKLDGQRHYFCSMACLEKYRETVVHTPN